MKRLLICIFAALMCATEGLAKNENSKTALVNNMYYLLDAADSSAMAVGAPDEKKKKNITYPEHVVFPDTIIHKHKKYVLRSIYNDVFAFNQDVKRVTIPNTLTSSDYQTYNLCLGLEEPVYNDTLFAYMPRNYVQNNSDYVIPHGIRRIEDWAFSGLMSLRSLVMPNTVTEIGIAAFSDCYALSSVKLSDYIKCISNLAFASCHNLRTIVIPNSVKSVNSLAFSECQLEKIVLGTGLEIIYADAFNSNYKKKHYLLREAELDENGQKQYTIREITIYREIPPKVEGKFNLSPHQEKIVLYVPFFCVEAYKNHPEWGKFDVRPIPPVNDTLAG